MDKYGCFGSILSRSPERSSCASCDFFQDCGIECDRVREALNSRFDAAKELTSLDKAIKKSKEEPGLEALEEITEVWGEEEFTTYERMKLVAGRCANSRSVRNIERWHGWGVDTQDIRRGQNPFRKEAEPFAHLYVNELIERKKIDADFYAKIAREMNYKPAAVVAQVSTMSQALYAASVLEKRDGVYTLREVAE